jgi:hypothetical protein
VLATLLLLLLLLLLGFHLLMLLMPLLDLPCVHSAAAVLHQELVVASYTPQPNPDLVLMLLLHTVEMH